MVVMRTLMVGCGLRQRERVAVVRGILMARAGMVSGGLVLALSVAPAAHIGGEFDI